MSKRTKRQSLLNTLDEVFGPPPDLPPLTSPKEAAMILKATDDSDRQDAHEKNLPRCPEFKKVCFPSIASAKKSIRKRQNRGAGFLRVYFCESCHSHHLTSKKPYL